MEKNHIYPSNEEFMLMIDFNDWGTWSRRSLDETSVQSDTQSDTGHQDAVCITRSPGSSSVLDAVSG